MTSTPAIGSTVTATYNGGRSVTTGTLVGTYVAEGAPYGVFANIRLANGNIVAVLASYVRSVA